MRPRTSLSSAHQPVGVSDRVATALEGVFRVGQGPTTYVPDARGRTRRTILSTPMELYATADLRTSAAWRKSADSSKLRISDFYHLPVNRPSSPGTPEKLSLRYVRSAVDSLWKGSSWSPLNKGGVILFVDTVVTATAVARQFPSQNTPATPRDKLRPPFLFDFFRGRRTLWCVPPLFL